VSGKPEVSEGLSEAIADVPKGWWWTVGVCGLTSHASVGPDRAFISEPMLTAFDGGFHADIEQPSTPAQALREACVEAAEAVSARTHKGTFI
jgi:hypothetical protein